MKPLLLVILGLTLFLGFVKIVADAIDSHNESFNAERREKLSKYEQECYTKGGTAKFDWNNIYNGCEVKK